jgi:phage-related protein
MSTTNNTLNNLQSQIDGAIQFWNGQAIPTLNNYPASDWTTEEERRNHQADIYTVIYDEQGE